MKSFFTSAQGPTVNSIMESMNKTLTANSAKVELLKNKLQNTQMVLESSNLGKYLMFDV